jgi:hypothetical protein
MGVLPSLTELAERARACGPRKDLCENIQPLH